MSESRCCCNTASPKSLMVAWRVPSKQCKTTSPLSQESDYHAPIVERKGVSLLIISFLHVRICPTDQQAPLPSPDYVIARCPEDIRKPLPDQGE